MGRCQQTEGKTEALRYELTDFESPIPDHEPGIRETEPRYQKYTDNCPEHEEIDIIIDK